MVIQETKYLSNNILMPKDHLRKRTFAEIGKNACFLTLSRSLIFWKDSKKPLTLAKTRLKRQQSQRPGEMSNLAEMSSEDTETRDQQTGSIVAYTEEEIEAFRKEMEAKNTQKITATAVRRFRSWYEEKHHKELDLNKVSKQEAPQLLTHFFLEIRQTGKENKGKEYKPGSLQTYRNGLRRYFLERPCPPAPDNFDFDTKSCDGFQEVANMLLFKKKDLKKKGFGNKPNAAQPLEDKDIKKLWESGAIGLDSPRALLNFVWWINVTHFGMRAIQEQHDCKLSDFTVTEEYIEYRERQTKNRQGNEANAAKRARKYNNKIWRTDGGQRDPYCAFVKYVEHRPKMGKFQKTSTSHQLSIPSRVSGLNQSPSE